MKARAQANGLRLKFLKIGAVVLRNSRQVRLHLSSVYPDKDMFAHVAGKLKPG